MKREKSSQQHQADDPVTVAQPAEGSNLRGPQARAVPDDPRTYNDSNGKVIDRTGCELEGTDMVVAAVFQAMFGLDFGLDLAGHRARRSETVDHPDRNDEGESAVPSYPPGRIPRGGPGLIARRTAHDEIAKLYYAVAMAELIVLPEHVARCAADKPRLNRLIGGTIGLDRAMRIGLIDRYVICWGRKAYPKTAHSIRLFVPGGRRRRERALGEMEHHLREYIDWAKEMGL